MALTDKIASLVGGNITDGVAKIISLFKVDPNIAMQNNTELVKIQNEMQQKILDSADAEMQAAAEIIKAEAQSQSWLARNVRPLLLLCWGSAITVNALGPVVARFCGFPFAPIPLDPWVYKLTAVGFTGYVTARTWEKVADKAS